MNWLCGRTDKHAVRAAQFASADGRAILEMGAAVTRIAFVLSVASLLQLAGQNTRAVTMVATVETQKGAAAAPLHKEDVMIYEDNRRVPAVDWAPVTQRDLWIVLDDGLDQSIGSQFGEIRDFIGAAPAGTRVGIGYMRNGAVLTAAALSTDRAAVAKALRLPMGMPGISASPYLSLVDLIHKWSEGAPAREVLLITSGVDPDYGGGPENPYLQQAIDAAQRAGVIVYSVYYGSAGHLGHSYWQINWGQNYLSQLSDETGGEFYWQGNLNPVSLAPYLSSLTEHLKHQFLLTFAPTGSDSAGFRRVRLTTEAPRTSLVAPSRVYVPAR